MKRIHIHHNNKDKSLKAKEELVNILTRNNYEICKEKPELIIVIGGDGTMLSAIKEYKFLEIPIIGINTGSLGFLPAIQPDKIGKLIDIIENKKYKLQKYPLLKVTCKTIDNEIIKDYAFNEILIKHLEPKLMEAKIYINDKPFNYFTGDGFIISTPIGATGYAIWAGGVATHSELPVYQLTPIHPNDNRINRPLKTPMVVPISTKMDFKIIKAESREVIVACDGNKISNNFISELSIRVSKKQVKILRVGEFDYFDYFKTKIIDKGIHRMITEF